MTREYFFASESVFLKSLNVDGCIGITTNPDKAQLFVRKRAKELYASELKARGWRPVEFNRDSKKVVNHNRRFK